MPRLLLVPVVTIALLAGAGIGAASAPAQTPPAPSTPEAGGTVWLCRPGLADNPCESNLATTVDHANGKDTVEHPRPAKKPAVDCFYVYPTVSGQPGPNADLTIDPEERAVAETQASRFSQVCRVFAPMYPQITVAAIRNPAALSAEVRVKAYAGVVNAWSDYLQHDNHGRRVVLLGHSQGASLLIALVKREIDPNPALRKQLVSALLIGANVAVPAGADVGGSFQNVPACRTKTQTSCVVAYSTFDQPPPADARFGRAGQGVSVLSGQDTKGLEVLCVNPAAPAGGSGSLQAFFRTTPFPGPLGGNRPSAYQAATPWVEQPDLYTGTCTQADGASWLQVDDVGRPTDDRVRVKAVLGPAWGLHLVDVNLALGNLVDLVRHEATGK